MTTMQRFQQALQAVGPDNSKAGRQDGLCPVLHQASRFVAPHCLAPPRRLPDTLLAVTWWACQSL